MKNDLKHASADTIILAVIALSVLGVAASLVIFAWAPGPSSTPAAAVILGFLAPTILALVAVIRQDRSKKQMEKMTQKIDSVHTSVEEAAVLAATAAKRAGIAAKTAQVADEDAREAREE